MRTEICCSASKCEVLLALLGPCSLLVMLKEVSFYYYSAKAFKKKMNQEETKCSQNAFHSIELLEGSSPLFYATRETY